MTLFTAFGQFAGSGAVAANDFEFISSTSVSAVSSFNMDNIFSADYSRYLIYGDLLTSVDNASLNTKLRVGGVTTTGSDYRRQYVQANGATPVGARTTGDAFWPDGMGYYDTTYGGFHMMLLFNPFEAVRTTAAVRHTYDTDGNIRLFHQYYAHDLANSYDGFNVAVNSGTTTGSVYVYGWRI